MKGNKLLKPSFVPTSSNWTEAFRECGGTGKTDFKWTLKFQDRQTGAKFLKAVELRAKRTSNGHKSNRIVKLTAQELCESRGGRPELPVTNTPWSLCTLRRTLNIVKLTWKLRWLVQCERRGKVVSCNVLSVFSFLKRNEY